MQQSMSAPVFDRAMLYRLAAQWAAGKLTKEEAVARLLTEGTKRPTKGAMSRG